MKLRPATMEDAHFLLKLKNDPVMRKFAVVTHKKIKLKAHLAWLKKHLGEIQIVMEKGKRLGMVRICSKEISINLAPEARGKGMGNKVLRSMDLTGLWAKIVNGNVPSMRLFLKNGFEITGYLDNFYVLQHS